MNLVSGVQVNSGQFGGVNIFSSGPASARINAAAGSSITTQGVGLNINGLGNSNGIPSTGTSRIDNAATIQAGFIGINIETRRDATINNSGALTLTGISNFGIYAASFAGNIAITNSGPITNQGNGGVSFGILTRTTGVVPAQTQITNSGAINITGAAGAFGVGIQAEAIGRNASVNITNSGAITVARANRALGIATLVHGNTTINSTGAVAVNGDRATGIHASTGDRGPGTITITSPGTVVANSTAAGGPDDAAGIYAQALGAVTITAGTVQTTGEGTPGISANTGIAPITITASDVSTNGDRSAGILAASGITGSGAFGGAVTVTSNNVTTAGPNSDGIYITGGSARVTTIGALRTSGDNSNGIFIATGTGGAVSIANDGSVATAGRGSAGMRIFGGGTLSVTGRGTVTTTGFGADGIIAESPGDMSIQTGAISTTGESATGIVAFGAAAVTIDATSISTRGDRSSGVVVRSAGPVNITTTNVSTTGAAAIGISAFSFGDVTITSTNLSTTGAGATGISAVSDRGGRVSITNTGALSVTGADISAITASTTGTINIANSGSITSASGFAIDASGGPATVTNSGTIAGRVRLTGFNDSFTNSGIFNANGVSQFGAGNDTLNNSGTIFANADMDFGAGTDTFNNSGILQVLVNRPPATSVTLTGLEAFNNSSLVDLRNGRTGDVLNIPGTFTATGASRLGLDVTFGATTTADRLNIGGAATGLTLLDLAITGTPALGTGPVLVQAGAGTSPTAFVLLAPSNGLVQLDLAFTNNAFTLVGAPSDTAYRATAFAGAVRNLWHESADAWSAQMREGRDTVAGGHAGEPGARFWFQGYGRLSEREQDNIFIAFGRGRGVDLSYDQKFFGGQGGLDFGGGVGDQGGFAFGVTGGYVDSHLRFEGVGDDLEMHAVNVGAYGRLSTGMFFLNALAKYDHILDISARSRSANYDVELDGSLYGASIEAGLRLGNQGFYVEPVASISYVHADLDNFAVTGTNLGFDADNRLRSSAGARIGSTFSMGSGATANVYAGASYVHDFGGDDVIVLSSGGTSLRVAALEERDYVKGLVGLNIGAGNVSGFFEGNSEFLNDRTGFGLRAGMRMRF